ncbi:MAG TPA: sulfite exporter TauE/SafE family protein [Vicinamibacterales bacterium]|jgi:hypothetical protein
MDHAVEPILLGFSSGLICTASCGAVLLPFLLSRDRGLGGTAALLAQFLIGRLVGYEFYATLVWGAVVAVPSGLRANALVFGTAHLVLALMLGWYAATAGRYYVSCGSARRRFSSLLVERAGWLGPTLLGLLSGVNLCGPFVAATVRAAETPGLLSSLIFFGLFFVGTTVWFLPFLGAAPLRRLQGAVPIARVAMAVVAVYYAYLGIVSLGARWLHG